MSRHGLQHGGMTAPIGGGHLSRSSAQVHQNNGYRYERDVLGNPLLEKELALAHDGLDEGATPSPGGPKPVANCAEAAPFAMLSLCALCARTRPHEHGVRAVTTNDRA